MLDLILERGSYWAIVAIMMMGLYIAYSAQNLIKRLVGLSLFQTTICLFFVMLGNVSGGTAPVLQPADMPAETGGARMAELANAYSNPLPHVLMLTAIVVGVATLSLGLALIVRINEAYGSVEADRIRGEDIKNELADEAEETRLAEGPA